VTLELGGNDPAIVLPDVDVADAAPKIFQGAMNNSGQVCVAIKRVFVHEDKCLIRTSLMTKLIFATLNLKPHKIDHSRGSGTKRWLTRSPLRHVLQGRPWMMA